MTEIEKLIRAKEQLQSHMMQLIFEFERDYPDFMVSNLYIDREFDGVPDIIAKIEVK